MNPTQFHPESDIKPLDSRGEELETTLKFNNIDSIYLHVIKAKCDLCLRLSERTQIV